MFVTVSYPQDDDMSKETKYDYMQWFIADIPRTDGSGCSKGGAVSYANAALFTANNRSVKAARFTSSHGLLSSSADFIGAR